MELSQIEKSLNDGKLSEALELINNYLMENKIPKHEMKDILLTKVDILGLLGRYDLAIATINEINSFIKNNNNIKDELDVLLKEADILCKYGNYDESFQKTEKGEFILLNYRENLKGIDSVYYAHLKRLKGIYFRFKSEDLDLSLEYFRESLMIYQSKDKKNAIADVYNEMGLVYQSSSRFERALEYYHKSLELKKLLNNEVDQAAIYLNIGHLYELQGELPMALENINISLTISSKYENKRLMSFALNQLALIHYYRNNFDNAFEFFTESLLLREELGNANDSSQTLFNLIYMLLDYNKIDLATSFYENLEYISEKNPEVKIIKLRYLVSKALLLKNANNLKERAEAQKILQEILDDEIYDPELHALVLINLAEMLLLELKITHNKEILDEIKNISNSLTLIAKYQVSHLVSIEIQLLEAKFAFLQLKISKSFEILNLALQLAQEKGLANLINKISNQYDLLLEFLENKGIQYKIDENQQISLGEVEDAEIEEALADLIQDSRVFEKQAEIPLLFLILNSSNKLIFSKNIKTEINLDEQLISSLINAINNIMKETFDYKTRIERLKHGKYSLLFQLIDDFTLVYLFDKGSSYNASLTFEKIISEITNNLNQLKNNQIEDKSSILESINEKINIIFQE